MASPDALEILERIAVAVEFLARQAVRDKPAGDADPGKWRNAVTAFVAAWNEERGPLPKASLLPGTETPRYRRIVACLKVQPEILHWRLAARALAASPHHRGGNDRGWVASIDFLISPSQFVKWLEAGEALGSKQTGSSGPPVGTSAIVWCAECGESLALFGPGTANRDMAVRPLCGRCRA